MNKQRANGNVLASYGSGDAIIHTKTPEGELNKITLKEVLFLPDIDSYLQSVMKATQSIAAN